MVMVADFVFPEFQEIAAEHPGRIGWLLSPRHQRWADNMPYALDNGKFSVWARGKPWRVDHYRQLLRWAARKPRGPLWALVPDVVADRDGTVAEWTAWKDELRSYGWPLAFAAQDGMTPDDVPSDADVVFVGGSFEWKRRTLKCWTSHFSKVHVGRANTIGFVEECRALGVVSVDGTGWRHPNKRQLLLEWARTY